MAYLQKESINYQNPEGFYSLSVLTYLCASQADLCGFNLKKYKYCQA